MTIRINTTALRNPTSRRQPRQSAICTEVVLELKLAQLTNPLVVVAAEFERKSYAGAYAMQKQRRKPRPKSPFHKVYIVMSISNLKRDLNRICEKKNQQGYLT